MYYAKIKEYTKTVKCQMTVTRSGWYNLCHFLLVAFSVNKLVCLQVDLIDRGKAQRARYRADCKDPDFEVRFASTSTTTHVSHLFIFVACAVFNSICSKIRHCHCNSLPYILVLDHCFEF